EIVASAGLAESGVPPGALGRIRTCGLAFRKRLLYPLSYEGLRTKGTARTGARQRAAAYLAVAFIQRPMPPTPPRPLDRRAVWSWAFFDFGNSAFTTLVVTFVYATFFTQAIAENEVVGTALWSRGITITALTVAALSPFLGAWADRRGARKRFLLGTTAVCVLFTALLFFPTEGQAMQALALVVVANIAFELG